MTLQIWDPLAPATPGAFRARCSLTTAKWERRLTDEERAEAKANGYPRTFVALDSERVDRETGRHGRWEIHFPACAGFETDDREAYAAHLLEHHNRKLGAYLAGYNESFSRSIRSGWRSPGLAPEGKPLPKTVTELTRTCSRCGLVAEVVNAADEAWLAEHERGCNLIESGLNSTDERESGATLSEDGVYRYSLWRRWDADLPDLTFVMLNPSKADAEDDDPTIQACVRVARRLGHGGIVVVNLYALISTDPRGLWLVEDPVGPDNDQVLEVVLAGCANAGLPVVAAWGANARDDRVRWLLRRPGAQSLHHLGLTKAGAPKHPLARGRSRIPDDAPLVPWRASS